MRVALIQTGEGHADHSWLNEAEGENADALSIVEPSEADLIVFDCTHAPQSLRLAQLEHLAKAEESYRRRFVLAADMDRVSELPLWFSRGRLNHLISPLNTYSRNKRIGLLTDIVAANQEAPSSFLTKSIWSELWTLQRQSEIVYSAQMADHILHKNKVDHRTSTLARITLEAALTNAYGPASTAPEPHLPLRVHVGASKDEVEVAVSIPLGSAPPDQVALKVLAKIAKCAAHQNQSATDCCGMRHANRQIMSIDNKSFLTSYALFSQRNTKSFFYTSKREFHLYVAQ